MKKNKKNKKNLVGKRAILIAAAEKKLKVLRAEQDILDDKVNKMSMKLDDIGNEICDLEEELESLFELFDVGDRVEFTLKCDCGCGLFNGVVIGKITKIANLKGMVEVTSEDDGKKHTVHQSELGEARKKCTKAVKKASKIKL